MSEKICWACLALVLALGLWLRWPRPVNGPGFDERLYIGYVEQLRRGDTYPAIVHAFLARQEQTPSKLAPPTRAVPLLIACFWARLRGCSAFAALRDVSSGASVLELLIAIAFARRLGGSAAALGVGALMACAPLQLHASQRALIDGFFSLCALGTLWAFWEARLRAGKGAWGWAYVGCLALACLAKETALFFWFGLFLFQIAFRNTGTLRLLVLSFLAPALATLVLTALCGGPLALLRVIDFDVQLPVSPYTVQHHDGPWFGYPLALFTLSPGVSVMAAAAILGVAWNSDAGRTFSLVTLGSMASLTCLSFQIVPRLASLWDFPLRWLVWEQLCSWSPRWRLPGVVILCVLELRQFHWFFWVQQIYDPVTDVLLHWLNVVK